MDDEGWRLSRLLLLLWLQNWAYWVESRPLLSAEQLDLETSVDDWKVTDTLPFGILITVATTASLLVVLILCACGEKKPGNPPQAVDAVDPSIGRDDINGSPSPSAEALTVAETDISVAVNDAPKQRTASVQSSGSTNAAPLPEEPLNRSATIDRRLPELPAAPIQPPPPTNEAEEDDYNRTYDVIAEAGNASKAGGQRSEAAEEETEDDQYASVSEKTIANRTGSEQNRISGGGREDGGSAEAGDEAYASVSDTDAKAMAEEAASYASVTPKEEQEGYARLRSFHSHPAPEASTENGERNGYARLRDLALENPGNDMAAAGGVVTMATGGVAGGAANEGEAVPPVPHKPANLENDEAEDGSPDQRSSNPSAAVNAMANDRMGLPRRREPPYTQVSARESLEVVRARQQAEQNACMATHYQTIEEDQALDADHDGIYEPVDDQQLDGQPIVTPPPLPGERHGSTGETAAAGSSNWQGVRVPRVYEEITEETRPKPPGIMNQAAATANAQTDESDDIQPYAITKKRPSPTDIPMYSVVDKKGKANYAKVNKTGRPGQGSGSGSGSGPDQVNNNARTETRPADPASPPGMSADLPLYAVVDKKAKSRESKAILSEEATNGGLPLAAAVPLEDNYQSVGEADLPVEDDYQSVAEMPGRSPSATAIAAGMIHVTECPPRTNDLWTKKEHMYIDVETPQPASTTPSDSATAETGRSDATSTARTAENSRSPRYETVEVPPPALSKKELKKQTKKAKKEAKKERKLSKGAKSLKEKAAPSKKETAGEQETVWQRQESPEGNGNSNNNSTPFDDYESIAFPLQETRL